MAVILYSIANIARAGATRSGYHSGRLMCQVGKRMRACRSGIARSGATRMGLDQTVTNQRRLRQNSLQINDTGLTEIPTCSFVITSSLADRPQDGDPVIIAVGTLQNRLFGGHLKNPQESKYSNSWYVYECTAEGYQKELRSRLVNATYEDQRAGAIVKVILAAYTTGFTWTGGIQDGALIEEKSFNFVSVLDACNQLANLSGFIFYVNHRKQVFFTSRTKHTAPWAISDSESFDNLEIGEDSSELKNRVILRYCELEEITETFKGDSEQERFILSEEPVEIISLKVDGADVTYDSKYSTDNSGNDFSIRYGSEKYIQTVSHATLTASNILEIVYMGKRPARLIVNATSAQSARASLEGGGGIYEHLIEERGIANRADALARAQDELTRFSEVLLTASYERKDKVFAFFQNRLRVGMQQSLTARGRSTALSIESITLSVFRHENDRTLGFLQQVSLGPVKQTLTDVFQGIDRKIKKQKTEVSETEEIVNV